MYNPSLYRQLSLAQNVSQETLRETIRSKLLMCHPDKKNNNRKSQEETEHLTIEQLYLIRARLHNRADRDAYDAELLRFQNNVVANNPNTPTATPLAIEGGEQYMPVRTVAVDYEKLSVNIPESLATILYAPELFLAFTRYMTTNDIINFLRAVFKHEEAVERFIYDYRSNFVWDVTSSNSIVFTPQEQSLIVKDHDNFDLTHFVIFRELSNLIKSTSTTISGANISVSTNNVIKQLLMHKVPSKYLSLIHSILSIASYEHNLLLLEYALKALIRNADGSLTKESLSIINGDTKNNVVPYQLTLFSPNFKKHFNDGLSLILKQVTDLNLYFYYAMQETSHNRIEPLRVLMNLGMLNNCFDSVRSCPISLLFSHQTPIQTFVLPEKVNRNLYNPGSSEVSTALLALFLEKNTESLNTTYPNPTILELCLRRKINCPSSGNTEFKISTYFTIMLVQKVELLLAFGVDPNRGIYDSNTHNKLILDLVIDVLVQCMKNNNNSFKNPLAIVKLLLLFGARSTYYGENHPDFKTIGDYLNQFDNLIVNKRSYILNSLRLKRLKLENLWPDALKKWMPWADPASIQRMLTFIRSELAIHSTPYLQEKFSHIPEFNSFLKDESFALSTLGTQNKKTKSKNNNLVTNTNCTMLAIEPANPAKKRKTQANDSSQTMDSSTQTTVTSYTSPTQNSYSFFNQPPQLPPLLSLPFFATNDYQHIETDNNPAAIVALNNNEDFGDFEQWYNSMS